MGIAPPWELLLALAWAGELPPPVPVCPPPVNVCPLTTVTPFETTMLEPLRMVPEIESEESVTIALLLEADADTGALDADATLLDAGAMLEDDPPMLIVAPLEKVLPEIVVPPFEELCAKVCAANAAMMRAT